MNAMFVFTLAVYPLKCRGGLRWSLRVLSFRWCGRTCCRSGGRRWSPCSSASSCSRRAVPPPPSRVLVRSCRSPSCSASASSPPRGTPTGSLGLPGTAVKTVLFPDQLGEADRSSDLYRQIEAFDLWFTIRAESDHRRRLRPASSSSRSPLPDISFFEFWEYIPHNAVLWIWVKMGFFGFVADAVHVRQGDPARRALGAHRAHAGAGRDRRHRRVRTSSCSSSSPTSTSSGTPAARSSSASPSPCAPTSWRRIDEHELVVEGRPPRQLETVRRDGTRLGCLGAGRGARSWRPWLRCSCAIDDPLDARHRGRSTGSTTATSRGRSTDGGRRRRPMPRSVPSTSTRRATPISPLILGCRAR